MEESNSKGRWLMIITVALAVLGIIVPILWYIIKNGAAVELRQTGQEEIIHRNDQLDKLQVQYDGKAIKDLSIMRFVLSNTGKVPIKESDMTQLPTIRVADVAKMLDVKVEGTYPRNLKVTAYVADPNTVALTFPLLNPGDNVQFSVLLSNPTQQTFTAEARIAGVQELKVIYPVKSESKPGRRMSWTVYPVGAVSFLFLFVSAFVGVWVVPKERRFKKLVEENKFVIPIALTKATAVEMVNRCLSWTTPKERAPLMYMIEMWPQDGPINDDRAKQLHDLMVHTSNTANKSIYGAYGCLFIASIGIVYVVIQAV